MVDDCGKDNSWEKIETLCSKYENIKGIQLRKNVGQHNAIFLDLIIVREVIITMDDDGQNSPESIEDLVLELKGYDVCYANYKVKKHNLFRRFGSFLNNIVASFLFKNQLI